MRSALLAIALLWPAARRADDYRDLFNGKDLEGWTVEGPQKDKAGQPIWSVREGMIVCTGKGFGFLRYAKQEFGDFAYRVEFRMSPKCNSGLGIRMPGPFDPAKSAATRPSYASYEIQLMDDAGKKPSPYGSGSLYRYLGPTANPIKPAGEWNTIEVECVGPRIRITLNDVKILDVDQTTLPDLKGDENKPASARPPKDKPLKGCVALQSHSNQIEFRKVQIREIGGKRD